MVQSNSEDSGLLSVFTDLFVDKPKPQPAASQSKPPPPQPKQQPPPQPKPLPKPQPPPPQPASESGPARRQDELVKRFPGSKIDRRPYDPHSTLFPDSSCANYMEEFYEAAQDSMMINVDMWFDQRFIRQKCGIQVKPDRFKLWMSKSRDLIERLGF